MTNAFPWASFLTFVLLMAWTPGPNNIMSMGNAARAGMKRAMVFSAGIVSGVFIIMLLSMAFSAVLFAIVPRIQLPMKILGALYMVFLAVKTVFPSAFHRKSENKAEEKETPATLPSQSFLSGVFLQFVNVKIMIYGVTAMSSYILPRYSAPLTLILFSAFLASVGFFATLGWALVGSSLNRLYKAHEKPANIILAALLIYCAVSLFF